MKKLMLLSVLLGLVGCNRDGKPHQVVCLDSKTQSLSRIVDIPGNPIVMVAEGQPVLAYYDEYHVTKLILLNDNDCVIE